MPLYYYGPSSNPKQVFQEKLIDSPPPAISIDVETVSLKERYPIGFSIGISPDEAFYFQVHPEPPRDLELLRPLLSNPNITKIAHNWMFDLRAFPLMPVCGDWLDRSNLFDTNVAARLLGRLDTKLHELAPEVGMEATPVEAMIEPKQTMLDLDPMRVANKCQIDAKVAYALYLKYNPEIQSQYPAYFKIEMDVLPVLLDMSLRGLRVDQEARAEFEVKLDGEIEFYRKICVDAGIQNPASPQQVGYILAKRGNILPFTRGRKRQLSTRIQTLEFLDDSLAQGVLDFRHKSKLQNTYIRPLAGEDRIYTEYSPDIIVGRVQSSNRNMQNIPPSARYIFIPDSGTFVTGDYAQEHLYILMHMSGDKEMRRVYEEGYMDGDIHKYTANQMRIPRRLAKTLNYAIIYGATPKTIMEHAKIRDLQRCGKLLDDWFDTFRDAAYWIKVVQDSGMRSGWAEPTLFGRRIRIPPEYPDGMRRKAVNYPILGSDGEVIKRAILLCDSKGLGPPTMCVTVHDSITWDGIDESQLPVNELEMIPGFKIPFDVKTTFRWE